MTNKSHTQQAVEDQRMCGAAKDMLSALELVDGLLDSIDNTALPVKYELSVVRAAIAKATGEKS